MGVPTEVCNQSSSTWEALVGEEHLGYHQVLFHLIYRAPRGKGTLKWLSGLRMARRSPGGGRSRGPVVVGGSGDSCKARLGKFVL